MTLLTENKKVVGAVTEFGWVTIGEGDSAHHVFLPGGDASDSKKSGHGSGGKAGGKSNNAPNPDAAKTKAFGSDPTKTYEFKHEVVDLKDLVASNTESGAINPDYTKELQPRNRERAASKQQVDKIAKTFVPEAALWDFHQLDKGPAIIGPDNMVESGNGRTIAMKKMAADHPEKWAEYQTKLKQHLSQAGLSEKDLEGKAQPVLVRRRLSQVDRAAFAQEANTAPVLQMSATEQALVDSKHISDAHIGRLEVGDDQTIDQALRSPKNRGFVSDFVGTLTPAERGPLMRGDGSLSQQGLWRVKAAVFTKTFPGEAGTRLADTFLESLDSNVKNFESGLSGALPKMAQADSLIKSGSRDKSLDISEDVSKSVDMLARLKEQGMPVQKFLNQGNMFGSELSGFQEKLLAHFDTMSRSAKQIRDFLNGYSDAVIAAPDPHQGNLFGPSDGPTKESIVNHLIGSSATKEKEKAGATSFMFTKELTPMVIGQLTKKNIVPEADSLAAAFYHDKAVNEKIEQGQGTDMQEDKQGTELENADKQLFASFAATDKSPILEEIEPDLDGEQEYIIKSGKIFEAGDYPDKKFTLTEEELKTAVSKFKPVALDIEHYPSLFDGKLGYLGGVSIGRDGKTLLGRVMLTKPAAELLKDVQIKVSTTWDAAKKTIEKLALVLDPRVSDAVVMGRAAHFSQESITADFEHLTEFVGARHNVSDLANLQTIHDTAASMGAVCSNDNNQDFSKELNPMPNSDATKPDANVATDASVALSSEVARLQAEIDKQNRQLVEMANRERRKDAVEFSGSMVKAGKITSATQEFLTAIFEQAARDDASPDNKPAALVVFSGGKGKETKVVPMESRIATLQAFFTALPASQLDKELVAGIVANPNGYTAQNLTALFDRGAANTDDPDEKAEADKKRFADKERLKSMTDIGKKAAKLAATK
jgi:hypothetical protein